MSVLRSKRRCVLEKKQPYSGDEWCSGPDTEEDDDKPRAAMHRESACFLPVAAILASRVMEARVDFCAFHFGAAVKTRYWIQKDLLSYWEVTLK